MKLYFLRHGIAIPREEWPYEDAIRPLTEKGISKVKRIASTLDDLELDIPLILTSPLERARKTAEIVANKMHIELKEDERLAPGFNIERLRAILFDHPDLEALMLVGHEPDFSNTISALIGGGRLICKKGGLALVNLLNPDLLKGELVWLLPPKILLR